VNLVGGECINPNESGGVEGDDGHILLLHTVPVPQLDGWQLVDHAVADVPNL
jgi:hypothetical protein